MTTEESINEFNKNNKNWLADLWEGEIYLYFSLSGSRWQYVNEFEKMEDLIKYVENIK
jgi:hypothetical protein